MTFKRMGVLGQDFLTCYLYASHKMQQFQSSSRVEIVDSFQKHVDLPSTKQKTPRKYKVSIEPTRAQFKISKERPVRFHIPSHPTNQSHTIAIDSELNSKPGSNNRILSSYTPHYSSKPVFCDRKPLLKHPNAFEKWFSIGANKKHRLDLKATTLTKDYYETKYTFGISITIAILQTLTTEKCS